MPFTIFADRSFSVAGLSESVKLKDSPTVETEIETFSLLIEHLIFNMSVLYYYCLFILCKAPSNVILVNHNERFIKFNKLKLNYEFYLVITNCWP